MALKIYNSLTRKKEEFHPRVEGKVGLYVCGITAYDSCHIGHARSAVVFDVMVRYLKYRGFEVNYVKNYTDVDDKIIEKANLLGISAQEVALRFIEEHDRDMERLGVLRPTHSPKATEHIDQMIALIAELEAKGLAYLSEGDVYFAVDKFPPYGRLSGRMLDEMQAGARVEVSEKKKHPLDFALWKAAKEGEPWWESPWGRGRPGWHIECSVMSQKYLGTTFDIHGGGEDLIFPHHENEIAQSQAATGKLPAHYWIHNGFIRVNREKMSKSLGNIFKIRDILEEFHPEVLRLFLLQSHYRSPLDFSLDSLGEAKLALTRLYATLQAIEECRQRAKPGREPRGLGLPEQKLAAGKEAAAEGFIAAMDDDFNTARAIGQVFDLARAVNSYLAENKSACPGSGREVLTDVKNFFAAVGLVLGILQEPPALFFRQERDRQAKTAGIDIGEIQEQIDARAAARKAGDYGRADEIRRKLAEKKIVIRDTPAGAEWSFE